MIHINRLKLLDVKIPTYKNCIVLDIGCSNSCRNVSYSIDINKQFNPSIIGDACSLPIKNKSIDIILFISVLEHLHTPQKAINEAYNALRKDGIIYVFVPFIFYRHDLMDYTRFTKEGILYLLKGFNIDIIELKYNGLFSVLLSWLIPCTYRFPKHISLFFQLIIYCFLKIIKPFDILKSRFYGGVFIKGIKN